MNKEHKKYPNWICSICGSKYGKAECGISTWHIGTCDICGRNTAVTEPRDFGHLVKDWENEKKEV